MSNAVSKTVTYVFIRSDTERLVKYSDGTKAIVPLSSITAYQYHKFWFWRKHYEWSDLLPGGLAVMQRRWEYNQTIIRMRDMGFTFEEIAKYWDISAAKAKQTYDSKRKDVSPAVVWMRQDSVFADIDLNKFVVYLYT
jgi:hypothetical protein